MELKNLRGPLLVGFAVITFFVIGCCCGSFFTGGGATAVAVGPKVIEVITAEHEGNIATGEAADQLALNSKYSDARCRADVPHCMEVRKGRAKIAPLDKSILPFVTAAFNRNVPGHVPWAQRCVDRVKDFERVHRKSVLELPMIMAVASKESAGCQMIGARNGDGGYGYMQITDAADEYKERAAVMLGHRPATAESVNLRDIIQNIAVGAIIWDECERSSKRRDLAPLCYNRGIGRVQTVAKWTLVPGSSKSFWHSGKPYPRYELMHPYINSKVHSALGEVARAYTADVFAEMAIVKMVMEGKTPRDLPEGKLLTLEDIPGWDPKHDGDEFVIDLIAGN